jgi:azurin
MMKGTKYFFAYLLTFLVIAVNVKAQFDSVRTIMLSVKAGLQFDIVRFRVDPGERVKIVLTNTDDMSHNLLITKPGARLKVVNEALQLGEKGPAMDYIPKSSDVLWATPVVVPNDIRSITFTAPAATGIYPYVCTLPGHGFVMYGAMYVTKVATLPNIKTDEFIPPSRRNESEKDAVQTSTHHHTKTSKPLHPYTPKSPYVYRVFIDGASPAAIAVSLPHELSYCWDATECRLRFAWEGGFLDNSDLWKGKGDALAKVAGSVFYNDKTEFPFRIANDTNLVTEYKGYRLINRYPEFHYTVNGIDVYELILPVKESSGLVRNIRIPNAKGIVSFVTHPDDGVTYRSSTGRWENGRLILSAQQAKQFAVTMIKKKGVGS